MKYAPSGAIFAWMAFATAASAQFPGMPGVAWGRGGYYSGRPLIVSGFVSGGPVLGPAWYPAFGYPYGGMRSTVIVVSPRIGMPAREPQGLGEPLLLGRDKDAVPINPDEVLVIRPRPGGLKNLPPPPREAPVVAVPPKLPEPAPKGFGGEPKPRQAPPPEPEAVAESERQIRLGREAFAAGEYGRAGERFAQATRVAPEKPAAYFLLVQGQFALGKYREATASILAGMKRQPDWPAAKVNARELYGDNAADAAVHLERLRLAVERNPEEPALLFLYGHQLWFQGRRDEARPFFRKAIPLTTDSKPIERFLAEPDGKMAVR